MPFLSGPTGRLPSQLVERWGALSPSAVAKLSAETGLSLPPPWDRLTKAHIQGLEQAFDSRRIAVDFSESPAFELPTAFRGFRGADRAVEAFRKLSAHDLNQTLWDLHREGELKNLIHDPWSGFVWWSNKKKLIDFLTCERLGDLTLPVRAVLILAMQEGVTAGVLEEGIVNILTGTRGEDLSRLKGILDRHSPQDFQKLVEADIDDKRRRRRILDHIAAEAGGVSTDLLLNVSDIDDTFYCNWKDERYPRGTAYPGVIAFYGALGTYGWNDWERWGPVFVSARPRDRLGIIEGITVKDIKRHGVPHPTVLSAGVGKLFQGIAEAKQENFVSYQSLFPEFSKVLVGDNGQKDVEFCRRAIQTHPETVPAAFIHNVSDRPVEGRDGYAYESLETPVGERRIFSFDTYIGAALAAHEMKPSLISLAGLQRVVRAATAEISVVPFESGAQRAAAHALFDRDRKIVERKYGFALHP